MDEEIVYDNPEYYYLKWLAAEHRCGELQESMKSQRRLHELEVEELEIEIAELKKKLLN